MRAATKGAAGEAGVLHHQNTTTHNPTIDTQVNTQGCFIHSLFSYTHSTFGTFICRDGCILTGMVVSMLLTCNVSQRCRLLPVL